MLTILYICDSLHLSSMKTCDFFFLLCFSWRILSICVSFVKIRTHFMLNLTLILYLPNVYTVLMYRLHVYNQSRIIILSNPSVHLLSCVCEIYISTFNPNLIIIVYHNSLQYKQSIEWKFLQWRIIQFVFVHFLWHL